MYFFAVLDRVIAMVASSETVAVQIFLQIRRGPVTINKRPESKMVGKLVCIRVSVTFILVGTSIEVATKG